VTEANGSGSTRQIVSPSGSLDQNIYDLFGQFPKGQKTAGLNRWSAVKGLYQQGLTSPAKMAQARKQLALLVRWVGDMTGKISVAAGDTRGAATARLGLYMSLYIFQGPATSPPAYVLGADDAIGIVSPTSAATIVTPSGNAGVALEEGSVDEETVVIITENPTPYPANCSGPLPTKLCQYPRFYHFSQFPHVKLNIAAKFAVCHVNHGAQRAPLADHDRFRLAHNLPANPADYTPGSSYEGGVEILPLISQTFSTCDDVEYALNEPTGLHRVFARATNAVAKLLTPKSAFAIDQGGGGMSFAFSDFNNLDPDGVPDDSISALSMPADTVLAGSEIAVSYVIENVGTATSPAVSNTWTLQSNTVVAAPPPPVTLTTNGIPSFVPRQPVTYTTTMTIPTSAFGSYTLKATLGSATAFPDTVLTNNVASKTIYVTSAAILARKLPGKGIGGR
jgi:hypothetical protein